MLIGGNQGFGLDLGILEHAGRVPGFGINDELMVTVMMTIISIKGIIVMVIISMKYLYYINQSAWVWIGRQ